MRIAVAGGTGVVGRHAVRAGRAAGHHVVVLARATGVDASSGDGLSDALLGVDVVVDAMNSGTTDEAAAKEFFVRATGNLVRCGAEAGVRHLAVLSIAGIDRAPTGYYAAKLAHERAALAGPVPATILRATQFHEFPAQMITRNRTGSVVRLPDLRVRTVAARTVGRLLVEAAAAVPKGRERDVGGPNEAGLVDLARRFVERFRLGLEVVPVAPVVSRDALLPDRDPRFEGPTFDAWLETADARDMA